MDVCIHGLSRLGSKNFFTILFRIFAYSELCSAPPISMAEMATYDLFRRHYFSIHSTLEKNGSPPAMMNIEFHTRKIKREGEKHSKKRKFV